MKLLHAAENGSWWKEKSESQRQKDRRKQNYRQKVWFLMLLIVKCTPKLLIKHKTLINLLTIPYNFFWSQSIISEYLLKQAMIQRGLSSFLSMACAVLVDILLVTLEIRFLLMFLIESHKRIDFQLIKVPRCFQFLLGLDSVSFATVTSMYHHQCRYPILNHLNFLRKR